MKPFATLLGVFVGFALGTLLSAPTQRGERTVAEDAKREPQYKPPEAPAPGTVWNITGFPPADGNHLVVIWRVIDGDSVEGGFVVGPVQFRLNGIDAPEMKTPEGVKAKAHLEKLIPEYLFQCRVFGREKYGRTLLDIWRPEQKAWVTALMVKDGQALPWDGRGKKPGAEEKP